MLLWSQPQPIQVLALFSVGEVPAGFVWQGKEYAVTSWLNIAGSVTPGEISRSLGITPTTLSAMIERLVRKKEIRRVRNPQDGRSYLLEPTAKGKATNARNGKRFEATIAQLRANLDGDPEEILEAMRRLEEALRRTIVPEKQSGA